jgi:hypothetical protein
MYELEKKWNETKFFLFCMLSFDSFRNYLTSLSLSLSVSFTMYNRSNHLIIRNKSVFKVAIGDWFQSDIYVLTVSIIFISSLSIPRMLSEDFFLWIWTKDNYLSISNKTRCNISKFGWMNLLDEGLMTFSLTL